MKTIVVLLIAFSFSATVFAKAQEVKIYQGAENYIILTKENADYFYKSISKRLRNSSEQIFWEEVADYFKQLPKIVAENNASTINLNDLIFPMQHQAATKLIIKNNNLIQSELLLGGEISHHTVDKMLMRDAVVIVSDYYHAMMSADFSIQGILKTLGVKKHKDDNTVQVMGATIHPFDVNEKYLGAKFLNEHTSAEDWLQLFGKFSLKDALDLAYSEEFANDSRHPLLGGNRSEVYAYFSNISPIYSNIYKLNFQLERDAGASFEIGGRIDGGEVLSLYLCHHHLKLDQVISQEFKTFCDFVFFKAFSARRLNTHPIQSVFDALNSRHNLHF